MKSRHGKLALLDSPEIPGSCLGKTIKQNLIRYKNINETENNLKNQNQVSLQSVFKCNIVATILNVIRHI